MTYCPFVWLLEDTLRGFQELSEARRDLENGVTLWQQPRSENLQEISGFLPKKIYIITKLG